jgi:hypothetical protein
MTFRVTLENWINIDPGPGQFGNEQPSRRKLSVFAPSSTRAKVGEVSLHEGKNRAGQFIERNRGRFAAVSQGRSHLFSAKLDRSEPAFIDSPIARALRLSPLTFPPSHGRHIEMVCGRMRFRGLRGILIPALHDALVTRVKADSFFAVSVIAAKQRMFPPAE